MEPARIATQNVAGGPKPAMRLGKI